MTAAAASPTPALAPSDLSLPHPRVVDPGRLAALERTGLLDSLPDESFDRLTRLVQRLLHAPVALVSLVDRDRQFFKSAAGLPEPWAGRRETPLSHSFCQFVVERETPLSIFNAPGDERVRNNAAITDVGVVAYLGVPVHDPETGHVLGSLCAIDDKPRAWTEEEMQILLDLGAQATAEVELRGSVRALEERERALAESAAALRASADALRASEARFERAVSGSSDGLWDWDIAAGELYLSPRSKAILGYADHEVPNTFDAWRSLLHPEERGAVLGDLIGHVSASTGGAAAGQAEYRAEYRMRHRDGSYR